VRATTLVLIPIKSLTYYYILLLRLVTTQTVENALRTRIDKDRQI
jgi:hypothetical protein